MRRCPNLPADFYPRPLRGGRRMMSTGLLNSFLFLSTPSARRATSCGRGTSRWLQFLSTPSARRATAAEFVMTAKFLISIHALCEEGDEVLEMGLATSIQFLSTPSARRATWAEWLKTSSRSNFYPRPLRGGRRRMQLITVERTDFYPRPLRGGRRSRSRWAPR